MFCIVLQCFVLCVFHVGPNKATLVHTPKQQQTNKLKKKTPTSTPKQTTKQNKTNTKQRERERERRRRRRRGKADCYRSENNQNRRKRGLILISQYKTYATFFVKAFLSSNKHAVTLTNGVSTGNMGMFCLLIFLSMRVCVWLYIYI